MNEIDSDDIGLVMKLKAFHSVIRARAPCGQCKNYCSSIKKDIKDGGLRHREYARAAVHD